MLAAAKTLPTIIIETMKKLKYTKPTLKKVAIDNQISMVMMSPPIGPDESLGVKQTQGQNPYKMAKG
jgi:hypothetical protein